jgi:hypothetical protein
LGAFAATFGFVAFATATALMLTTATALEAGSHLVEFFGIENAIAIAVGFLKHTLTHALRNFVAGELAVFIGIKIHHTIFEAFATARSSTATTAIATRGTTITTHCSEIRTHFFGGNGAVAIFVRGLECRAGVGDFFGRDGAIFVRVQGLNDREHAHHGAWATPVAAGAAASRRSTTLAASFTTLTAAFETAFATALWAVAFWPLWPLRKTGCDHQKSDGQDCDCLTSVHGNSSYFTQFGCCTQ